MKSNKQTYGFPERSFLIEGKRCVQNAQHYHSSNLSESYNELRSNDNPQNHPAQLIEYDDLMRQEEKKYSQLLQELKKDSQLIQSSLNKGNRKKGISYFEVDEPIGTRFGMARLINEAIASECEATRLTDDEFRYGCEFTMEQVLRDHKKLPPLEKNECLNKNSTQQSIEFQYTLSVKARSNSPSSMINTIQAAHDKISKYIGSEFVNANRLWLKVGEMWYSNFSECDSTAAINSAGPEVSRRNKYWHPSSCNHFAPLPLGWNRQFVPQVSWDSILVESVRLVLKRWRGVCSFSQTIRNNRSDEKIQNVFSLNPKKRS